jgi:hypothetical protein
MWWCVLAFAVNSLGSWRSTGHAGFSLADRALLRWLGDRDGGHIHVAARSSALPDSIARPSTAEWRHGGRIAVALMLLQGRVVHLP